MTDGTVKVTAEAHLHASQLSALLNGPLADVLNQISSNALALADPNIWAGQAAAIFANDVWPQVQGLLTQVQGSLGQLQGQINCVLGDITAAGSGLLGNVASGGAGTFNATLSVTTQAAASL